MPIDVKRIEPDSLYLVVDAAKFLGVSEQTVRSYLNEGTLVGVKTKKKRWRIAGREILKFINVKS